MGTYNDENLSLPIKIIPFPNGNKDGANPPSFTSKKLEVNNDNIRDHNDINNTCDYKGIYKVDSSSEIKGKEAYNAFNNNTTSEKYWESSDSLGETSYEIYEYDSNSINATINSYKSTYGYFNYVPSFYASSNNTNINNKQILGEWIQIEIPKPIFLYSYCIKAPSSNNNFETPLSLPIIKNKLTDINTSNIISPFPRIFMLVGSNDGNKWDLIDQQSLTDVPQDKKNIKTGYCYDESKNEMRIQINSIKHYRYFRLIITALFPGNKSVKISSLSLYGFIRFPVQNDSTLQDNLTTSDKNGGTCNSIESFLGITNSQEYLKGVMNNSSINDFSNEENNYNLLNIYKELQDSINEAKNNNIYLPGLKSYDIFTKQIFENFDDHGYKPTIPNKVDKSYPNPTNMIEDQINPLKDIYNDYLTSTTVMNQNVLNLESKIDTLNKEVENASNNDIIYDYNNNNFDKEPTLLDGRLTDNKEYIIQQNTVLILSTITITTLVLALFLIYK